MEAVGLTLVIGILWIGLFPWAIRKWLFILPSRFLMWEYKYIYSRIYNDAIYRGRKDYFWYERVYIKIMASFPGKYILHSLFWIQNLAIPESWK